MEITKKMKIAAVGLAALVSGCYSPINEQTSTLYVPKECARVKSIVKDSHTGWNLTCETEQGTDVYYRRIDTDDGWKRYSIEKK